MGLESDDDDDDDDEDDDVEGEKKSDADTDEEDTVQANIDEMDRFRLPGAEESEKEGGWLSVFSSLFRFVRNCFALNLNVF